jgi:hypothetical protein
LNCRRRTTIGLGALSFFFSLSALASSSSSASGSSGSTSDTINARRAESGDQASEETLALKSVSFTASPPSRLMSQTCVFFPSRPERNASHLPSGLQRGLFSAFLLAVRRRAGPPANGAM